MGIKAWHDQNIFMPTLCVFLTVLGALIYWPRFSKTVDLAKRRRWIRFMIILCSINGALAFTFEIYYYVFRCAVSTKYFDTTVDISRFATGVLVANNIPFWAESATLLEVLRLGTINPWDHDTDYSMVHPGDAEAMRIVAMFSTEAGHTHATYSKARGLIQIMNKVGAQGPHVDIWFWDKQTDPEDGRVYVVGAQSDFKFYRRPWDSIFPLQLVPWAGVQVNVPYQAHYLMRGEYGQSYMQKFTFKGDCTHNIFSARWWPF